MNSENNDNSLKLKVWELVEAVKHEEEPRRVYDLFDIFMMVLIILNVLVVILETVQTIEEQYRDIFHWFEIFSVIIFTVEYLARVWSCTSQEKYFRPFWGRLKFILTPMAIIDLIAIIPFYLSFSTLDLRYVRTLRLFRLFRIFKLIRYSHSLTVFGNVFRSKREELFITVMIMLVLIILTSSSIYYAEHEAQPDKFTDIPSSMWWAIVTLTTVGYGDVFPITPLGKLFAGIIAILGVGMVALPTGILGASFVEELNKLKANQKITCPHCGEEIGENEGA
jgi:voltage-gated potassium channel